LVSYIISKHSRPDLDTLISNTISLDWSKPHIWYQKWGQIEFKWGEFQSVCGVNYKTSLHVVLFDLFA